MKNIKHLIVAVLTILVTEFVLAQLPDPGFVIDHTTAQNCFDTLNAGCISLKDLMCPML